MHIKICAIGKQKQGPYHTLIQEYLRRIPHKVSILEINAKNMRCVEALQREEAALLRAHITAGSYTVALDERGENLTSPALSQRVVPGVHGKSEIVFLIGGAHGLDPSVRDAADFCLSFGKMVWPHQMVRLMLVEQIYRALLIHQNHPYHK